MGLSMGGSSNQSQSNQSGNSSNTYSAPQSNLQSLLTSAFSSLVPGISSGGLTPNVAAQETGSADTINKTSQGLGTRVQNFLASRGFGASGQSGQAEMDTELGRESALGANTSAAAGQQLNLNQGYLTDALASAFQSLGSSTNGATSSSGSGSNWNASGSAAFSF